MMYYLRKEPYKKTVAGKNCITYDRAIYKSNTCPRFYKQWFRGIGNNPIGMHLYTCKTIKTIQRLRRDVYDYCGEVFDVYDENGIVNVPFQIEEVEKMNEPKLCPICGSTLRQRQDINKVPCFKCDKCGTLVSNAFRTEEGIEAAVKEVK